MHYQLLFLFLCIACVHGVKPKRRDMTKKEISQTKDLLAGLELQEDKFNKEGRPKKPFRFVRHSIIKAQTQNVSLILSDPLYYVEEKIVESTCNNTKENDGKTIKECPAKKGKVPLICSTKIWSRPKLKDESKRLTGSMKCMKMKNVTSSRVTMSAKEIGAAKDLIKGLDLQIERFNNKTYQNKTQHEFRFVRYSIVKAQKHIVAGTMYYVEIQMIESTCKNIKANKGKTIKECPAKKGALPLTCIVEVWSHHWMKAEAQRLTVNTKC